VGALAVVSPSHDIETLSPAVSPNVVARILMIQNPKVMAGTLVSTAFSVWVTPQLLG
jgi:hypothetical protein